MTDEGNLQLVTSASDVDRLNAEFYATFPYPWPATIIEKLIDPHFAMRMQSQSVGSWDKCILPANPSIWIGGCGVNQGAHTAVRFPTAKVLGSDLSTTSLKHEGNTVQDLGLTNLTLKRESITDVEYREQFDYVISTGVIMITADPRASLANLARALKPSGIMQIMVYNRFHRITVTSFQKAVRILEQFEEKPNFRLELKIARQLLADSASERMPCRSFADQGISELADALIQPVEYGYTVESFEAMAEQCGLELLAPFIDPFSLSHNSYLWNLNFSDPELRQRYEALPDSRRWQITNLLLAGKSPYLWFYLQRKDSGRERLSEHQMCEMFLDRTFTKNKTERQIYIRRPNEHYELLPARHPYPGSHPDPLCRRIVEQVAQCPAATMREILQRSGSDLSFYEVNRIRLNLTSEAFPFLQPTTMSL